MSYHSYRSSVSPLSHMNPNLKKQIQIEELDHKVDVILQHNQVLKEENQSLKKKLMVLQSRSSNSSFTQKRQLEIKMMEMEQLRKQTIIDKELFSSELDNLTSTLNIMTDRRDALEIEVKQLQTKLFATSAENQLQRKRLKQQHRKQLSQENLRKNVQKNQQINEIRQQHIDQVSRLRNGFEEEKADLHEQKLEALSSLENKYEKEIFELKKRLQQNTREEIRRIQNAAIEKCRKERQKAEEYVQIMLQNHKQHQQYNHEELKKQIQDLRESLASRQKVIEGLIHAQQTPQKHKYYNETQQLRSRIKELTENFFKETELLKIKMAIKHEADVKEVSKAFGDRLDICQARIQSLELENERIREKYEAQIRNKLKLRQKFEVQASKLKNVIRKMKIELESYGKQIRLNIDGVKDQANSFSMSMIAQLGQEKTKKGFFEEEMRKMREVLDMKEQQLTEVTRSSSEKVKYYEDKVDGLKKRIEELKEQVKDKESRYIHDLEEKDRWAKIQLQKEQNHYGEEIDHMLKEIEDQKQKSNEFKTQLHKVKAESKQKQNQIAELHHQLDLSKAHIQSLRLEMEMFAANVKPDEALIPMKEHYERIIEELKNDKELLKENNSVQAQQITQLVAKYQDLQRTLHKTLSTMKKHSELNKKVMELGMDQNLVKNLAQMFISCEQ